MATGPSERRKEIIGQSVIFEYDPLVQVETDGFSYSPAMRHYNHGLKAEDYPYTERDTAWFSPGKLLEQLYEIPRRSPSVFEFKPTPTANPIKLAVTGAEAIHLGRDPELFDEGALMMAQINWAMMEFPPFETVPTPPEQWRIMESYKTAVLAKHRHAINMLYNAMFFFRSTPSKAQGEHKLELAKIIREQVWRPMILAASDAHNWTPGQTKLVYDALDAQLFFHGTSTERKKIWKDMLEFSEGYVINKQRLFAHFAKKVQNK